MFNDFSSYIFGLVLGAVIAWIVTFSFMEHNYEHGQIDAINGKIKYELVVQSNNTVKWEKKENNGN